MGYIHFFRNRPYRPYLPDFFKEEIGEGIKKVDLSSKLRGFLGKSVSFSISEKIGRILILIMSAASVAIIVRAIIFIVNLIIEISTPDSLTDASKDWLIDITSDLPVINVMMLLGKINTTDLRPDFFVIVMLGSLIVLGIAAVVVQVIMTLVNKAIYAAKAESTLFRILGNFSVITLTVAGTLFLSSLISPLLDFSKPWDGFENFCRPFLSSNVGNFLLQVLVTAVMFALLVLICFDWVQTMVLGAAGFLAWLIIMLIIGLITALFTGSGTTDSTIFLSLFWYLYPIFDIIKNRFFNEGRYAIFLPVAIPIGLSVIITLISIAIGKIDAVNQFFRDSPLTQGVGLIIFIVYLLALPGVEIVKSSDE